MPRIGLFSVVLLLLVTFGCAPKVDVEAERAAIRDADSAWSKTASAKDVDGFVSFFGDGASFFPPNTAAMTDREAIRKWASDSMANPGFAVSCFRRGARRRTELRVLRYPLSHTSRPAGMVAPAAGEKGIVPG